MTFVLWANNYVGTQPCPTPPGRSAERSDPTRPARGVDGFWVRQVLGSTTDMLQCVEKTSQLIHWNIRGSTLQKRNFENEL